MRVVVLPDRTEQELSGPMRVDRILSELRMNPETVLVLRSGALLTPDQKVDDDEEIEIWPVISGGRDDNSDAM
jgi:sulfur carrier protein